MDDRELKRLMRVAADKCFAGIDEPAARYNEIMRKMRAANTREKRIKRKMTLVLVFAMVCLLGGIAVAAGLGVFGAFTNHELSEMSALRLNALDTVSDEIGVSVTLTAPGEAANTAQPASDAEAVIAGQAGREFTLTVNQAYSDGVKLYYSYTLKTDALQTVFGEGKPAGVDNWDIEDANMRLDEIWSFLHPDQTAEAAEWLNSHDASYVIMEEACLGDGVSLDGKPLNIYDSNSEWMDGNTLRGYQEVRLPEDYMPGDELTIQLSILYGATVFYQDETGLYCKSLSQRENRGILRAEVTVPVNGRATAIAGTRTTDSYTVEARLFISDVDIYGTVTVTGAQNGSEGEKESAITPVSIRSYTLVAGEEELHNLDGAFSDTDDGRYILDVRYDLPSNTDNLILRPTGATDAASDILLRPSI